MFCLANNTQIIHTNQGLMLVVHISQGLIYLHQIVLLYMIQTSSLKHQFLHRGGSILGGCKSHSFSQLLSLQTCFNLFLFCKRNSSVWVYGSISHIFVIMFSLISSTSGHLLLTIMHNAMSFSNFNNCKSSFPPSIFIFRGKKKKEVLIWLYWLYVQECFYSLNNTTNLFFMHNKCHLLYFSCKNFMSTLLFAVLGMKSTKIISKIGQIYYFVN